MYTDANGKREFSRRRCGAPDRTTRRHTCSLAKRSASEEIAEQVAIRLRRVHKQACQVSISIGFSKIEGKRSLQAQMKIEPANNTRVLISHVIELFRKKYQGGAVRSVSVSYANFVDERIQILSLFDNPFDF